MRYRAALRPDAVKQLGLPIFIVRYAQAENQIVFALNGSSDHALSQNSRWVVPQIALISVFQSPASPDNPEQQISVPPVINIDDIADTDMTDDHDPADHQERLPRPVAKQKFE
ncbi:MAG: hypothetical protein RIR97_1780, partial [Pseudomonadota bacterium]